MPERMPCFSDYSQHPVCSPVKHCVHNSYAELSVPVCCRVAGLIILLFLTMFHTRNVFLKVAEWPLSKSAGHEKVGVLTPYVSVESSRTVSAFCKRDKTH